MDHIKEQLLNQITQAQNRTLDTLKLIPMDTPGRSAVALAWEALRLGWYMLKEDRVGISEKTQYVQRSYAKLMRELDPQDQQ
ncbi:MAG: hypothetical protein KDE46_24915 [Caldilineaceae bacterium]|nr:hypothetical protein [Caldilineaceae bacterium]